MQSSQPTIAPLIDMQWTAGGGTHPGKVRAVNEDAWLSLPEHRLWAVADGMGGHASGRLASQMVIQGLASLPFEEPALDQMDRMVDAVEDRLLEVNAKLKDIARERGQGTIGSTVAVLVERQRHVLCMWAGDSRIYRWRDGDLARLTQDHAVVEDLVASGMLAPEQAERDPRANRITRAVGGSSRLLVDVELFDLAPGDRFLLCSDGLYREVSDRDIAAILVDSGVKQVVENLIDRALTGAARDNITAVVASRSDEKQTGGTDATG